MNVRFLIPARRELADAFRYYESEQPGLGESLRDAAWDAVQRVRRLPNAYPTLEDIEPGPFSAQVMNAAGR